MKAEEARKLAIESAGKQINEIKNQIQCAAEVGNLSIYISDLKPATKEWLIDNGYKIDQSNASNYNIYSISWNN